MGARGSGDGSEEWATVVVVVVVRLDMSAGGSAAMEEEGAVGRAQAGG